MIPKQLCSLKNISIMDLSRNNFSETITHCFHNMTFGKIDNFYGFDNSNWDIHCTLIWFRYT